MRIHRLTSTSPVKRTALPLVALALAALQAGACGDGDAPTADEGSAPVDGSALGIGTAPGDFDAPAFDGPVRIELLGVGVYRVSWEPAVDNRSAPEAIRYRIDHAVEPFASADEEREPVLVTEPGARSAIVTLDRPSGRFWLRAMDEAGNISPPTAPIAQRSRIAWQHADGTALATFTHCVRDMSELVCVGDDGQAARWDGVAWQQLAAADGVDLHAVETPAGIHVFSGAGHLWKYDHDAGLVEVPVGFVGARPTLPFRDFGADALGLSYWVDDAGMAWVGVPGLFRPMRSPLAIPGLAGCTRLRSWWFGRTTAIAICEDGSVYSTSTEEAGMRWSPVTSTTPWQFEEGIRTILQPAEAGGVVVDPGGLRRVGVGGWQPLLEAGLDRAPPEGAFAFGRINAVETLAEGGWLVATDRGVLRGDGVTWRTVDAPAGHAVGLLPRGLGEFDVVYADATVASVGARGTSWRIEPRPGGFTVATATATGEIYALGTGETAALYRWDAGWVRVADAPAPALSSAPTVFAAADASAVYAAFTAADQSTTVWRYSAGRWSTMPIAYPAPAPVPQPGDPPVPPPPLSGVEARRAGTDAPPMQPVVDIDITTDGRALLVTANQAWWLVNGTWFLVGRRTGTITGGIVDAAETYLLVEDGAVGRCWRDRCGAGVLPVNGAPERVVALWRDARGLNLVDPSGVVRVFSRGTTGPAADALDPAAVTPPGSFVETAGAIADIDPTTLVGRFNTADVDVVALRDGRVMTRREGTWYLQARMPDLKALFATGPTWAILTPAGLIAPAEAAVAEWQR